MTQATVWHLIVSIFSAIGVTWLKAREWVRARPGLAIVLWLFSIYLTWRLS